MDTATTPTTSPASPPAPPRKEAAGAPEHSVLSMVLLVLLSAGALYAADWVLRDDGKVVQQWNLAQPVDPTIWEFPGKSATTTAQGMVFEMPASGFGPRLDLSLPTESVRWIKAHVSVVRVDTGKPVRFALGWYWARQQDLEEAPDGPFSLKRSLVLNPYVRRLPDAYRADMLGHEAWNGTIEAAIFTLKFPEEETGPFRVTFSSLEFLE
jgi:hypothetical protein